MRVVSIAVWSNGEEEEGVRAKVSDGIELELEVELCPLVFSARAIESKGGSLGGFMDSERD